jgi:hypothetical protein
MQKEDAEVENNDEGDDDVLPAARALRRMRKNKAPASVHLGSLIGVT